MHIKRQKKVKIRQYYTKKKYTLRNKVIFGRISGINIEYKNMLLPESNIKKCNKYYLSGKSVNIFLNNN